MMGSSSDRAAALVQAIEATVTGDSRVVGELYVDDVQGWSPTMTVTSAAQLAVELEDRQDAFSDIELDVTPLDVGDDQACVEWIATATHSGPLVVDEDVVIEPSGGRFTLRGVTVADFEGDRIRAFRQYWDEVSLLEQLQLLPTE
ncbi:MAG TPA: ester cyclase [Acidimicrobiia bacterium]|jgi:ketosteroid isomerase-like protein|nr:ester cyclase [Acidimicrobiia bacterium]